MGEVLDLDVLRPEAKVVKLAGKKIDVSYIPCGITFDLNDLIVASAGLDMAEVKKGGAEAKKGFDIALQMCALLCSVKYPDLTLEWFRANTSPAQILALSNVIKATLTSSLESVEGYQKN